MLTQLDSSFDYFKIYTSCYASPNSITPGLRRDTHHLVYDKFVCLGLGIFVGSNEKSKEAEQPCLLNAESTLSTRGQDSLRNKAKWCTSSSCEVREHCFCF